MIWAPPQTICIATVRGAKVKHAKTPKIPVYLLASGGKRRREPFVTVIWGSRTVQLVKY